jgi:hypothetical protein
MAVEAQVRPRSVQVVVAVLGTLAVICVLGGFAATAASSCCGSPDPPDSTYALVGLVLGGALVVAAIGLWSRRLPVWTLLACAATVPVTFLIAASSSVYLAALLPFAVAGWFAFWWFLRRPRVAAWLRSPA